MIAYFQYALFAIISYALIQIFKRLLMKKMFYLLSLSILIGCNNKESVKLTERVVYSNKFAPETSVYSLLNFVLSTEAKNSGKYITENLSNYIYPGQKEYFVVDNDSLFDKEDIKFIHTQIAQDTSFRLNQSLIKDKIVISFDTLFKLKKKGERSYEFWERFDAKYGQKEFYSIGLPLFTVDRKTAIVKYGYHCGSLCGGGEVAIFKLIAGKWKKIKIIETWIS